MANLDINVHARTRQAEAALGRLLGGGKGVLALGVGLGAAAGAGAKLADVLLDLANGTASWGDDVAKAARDLEVTNKELQVLDYVAKRGGVSIKNMRKGVQNLSRSLREAHVRGGSFLEDLEALGIKADDLPRLLDNPNEAFLTVIDRLQDMGDTAEGTALRLRLFGGAGREMGTLVEGGREEVEQLAARLEELDVIMSDEGLRSAERYSDAVEDLEMSFEGLKRQVGEAVLPTLTELVTYLTDDALPSVKDFGASVADLPGFFAEFVTEALRTIGGDELAAAWERTGRRSSLGRQSTVGGMAGLGETDLFDFADPTKVGGPGGGAPAGGGGGGGSRGGPAGPGYNAGAAAGNDAALQALMFGENADAMLDASHRVTSEIIQDLQRVRAAAVEAETSVTESLYREIEQREAVLGEALAAELITQRDHDEMLLALEAEFQGRLAEIREQEHREQLRRIEEERRAAQQSLNEQWQSASATTSSVEQLFGALEQAVAKSYDGQSAKAKNAAKVLFAATKTAALASAIVNTAQAVTNALATVSYPANIAAAGSVAALGAVEIGTIVGQSIAGVADEGLSPEQIRQARLGGKTVLMDEEERILSPGANRNFEALLAGLADTFGTTGRARAQSAAAQAVNVNVNVPLDGETIYRNVERRMVRNIERRDDFRDRVRS